MRFKKLKSKFITFLIFIFPGMRLLFYISLFTVFFITPVSKISNLPLCSMYFFKHIVCSTCGTTRAFSNIMHGNFTLAFSYNEVFVLAVFPIFTFLFIEDSITYIKRLVTKKFKPSLLEYVFYGGISWFYLYLLFYA